MLRFVRNFSNKYYILFFNLSCNFFFFLSLHFLFSTSYVYLLNYFNLIFRFRFLWVIKLKLYEFFISKRDVSRYVTSRIICLSLLCELLLIKIEITRKNISKESSGFYNDSLLGKIHWQSVINCERVDKEFCYRCFN